MSGASNGGDVPSTPTEPQGWAFVNYSTCVKCFSTRWHMEMRDPWFDGVTPPPPESMGEWRVCDRCSYEWPVQRPDIFQFQEMRRAS